VNARSSYTRRRCRFENGGEQRLLVLEVDVDEVLVALGGPGDAVDARAGDAVGGELRHGRLQDPFLLVASALPATVSPLSLATHPYRL